MFDLALSVIWNERNENYSKIDRGGSRGSYAIAHNAMTSAMCLNTRFNYTMEFWLAGSDFGSRPQLPVYPARCCVRWTKADVAVRRCHECRFQTRVAKQIVRRERTRCSMNRWLTVDDEFLLDSRSPISESKWSRRPKLILLIIAFARQYIN